MRGYQLNEEMVFKNTFLRFKLLQFLAGFKSHDSAWRNHYFLSGARISAHSGFARAHGENSEAAQLNAIAAAHRVFQRLDHSFHGVFGFRIAHASCRYNGFHDVNFDHAGLRNFECELMLVSELRVVKRVTAYYTAFSLFKNQI
jgi:hypothetical protein